MVGTAYTSVHSGTGKRYQGILICLLLYMRHWFFVLTSFILTSWRLQAQPVPYPKYYFRNPLNIPMQLTANFGELRQNHWHMGLDLRTGQKENFPVFAAADGYIAHVGIQSQSFGRYIIINHPNGFSTLYAHLNDFFPALEQYVTEQQYKQETWEIELDMPKEKFPVFKSKFIAYSGNTGASQGPHLHFEIRNTKTDRCLNPLFFGLPVPDNVPPDLIKLSVYDRSYSVYEQTPALFSLKKTDSGYIIPKLPVIKTGLKKISFGIQAYDRVSRSPNPNGIYSAQLFFDHKPQISFALDSLSYGESEYVDAQVDYKYRYDGGVFIQHLSQLPGDRGVVYKPINGDGVITLSDTGIHAVSIEIKDAYLNASKLRFFIQYNDSLGKMNIYEPDGYLEPLQHFIPNSVNILDKPDFEVYLPEGCLYDTIQPLYYRNNSMQLYSVSALYQLNDASIPLHDDITIRIKPNKPIPDEWKDKLIIQRGSPGNSVHKAVWQNDPIAIGWLMARFGSFGTFQAFADTLPPEIKISATGDTLDFSPDSSIIVEPMDNFGGIKNFRAELDSQWVRFTNDKGRFFIYKFDERCPFGVHQLKVTAEDLVGNTTTKTWWFKRYQYTPPKKKIVHKKRASSKRHSDSYRKGSEETTKNKK